MEYTEHKKPEVPNYVIVVKRTFVTMFKTRVIGQKFLQLNRNQILTVSSLEFSNDVITKTYPKRIFSGIQPTGSVHLGNYLGAIKYWKQYQDLNDNVIYSIVDLHSITLPQDPKLLYNNVLEMTATLLACGIDPKKSILFQQSYMPQHVELFWQLGCLSTMARLAHLPQYREKSAALKDIPLGLFVYPVLQAADILIYKATHVPVGEDQVQHLRLTQELARMFNKRFGETFPIPHADIAGNDLSRLRSLRDPTKKMSKSDPDPKSRISLLDNPDDIIKKIKKAVTDLTSEVYYDLENRPGVSNLIGIHSAVSGESIEDICKEASQINTGQYKVVVAEAVIQHLQPITSEIKSLLNDKHYLKNVLEDGAQKANEIAETTATEVRLKMGLRMKEKRKTPIKQNIQN